MPRTVVELSEHANRVVNVVKAMEGLPGKSAAIERIIGEFEEKVLNPRLRAEFVADVQRLRKGKFRKVRSPDEVLGRGPSPRSLGDISRKQIREHYRRLETFQGVPRVAIKTRTKSGRKLGR